MRQKVFFLLVALSLFAGATRLVAEDDFDGQKLRMADPPVRAYMDKHLPPIHESPLPPDEEDLQLFDAMLEKGDPGEAERVAWVLGDWVGSGNVSLLLKAAEHDVAAVRAQAATSLGRLSPVLEPSQRLAVVEQLSRMLSADDSRVVASALRSLGELRATAQAEEVGRFVGSAERTIAVAAIRAIGKMGKAKNFSFIESALDSDDIAIRRAAVAATGGLGDAELASQIVGGLQAKSPSVRVATINAIQRLGAGALEPQLLRLLDDKQAFIRRESLKALISLGGDKYERDYLHSTSDEDHSVRLVATRAIGQFELTSGVPHLVKRFSDENKYVRQAAVNSLVTIGTTKAEQQAATALSSDFPFARSAASQALGRLKSQAGAEQHLKLLRDEHLPARRWAAWAMGQMMYKPAAAELFDVAFSGEQDAQVTAGAILSMGKLGYRKVLPECHRLLPQKPTMSNPGKPTAVRAASARTMGVLKDEKGLNLLVGRLEDWQSMIPEIDEIREESAIAMGRIGSDRALPALRSHMTAREESYRIRIACHWAISRITGETPPLDLPPRGYPQTNYFVSRLKEKGSSEDPAEEQ